MLHVLLLRDEECASCDEVRAELDQLKTQFPELRLRERLVDDEPELAGRLGVVATPALIINDQLAFQGHPDRDFLEKYLEKAQNGQSAGPDAYPPQDERDPDARGQEATGSSDPEWRGSGRSPSFGSSPGGRH